MKLNYNLSDDEFYEVLRENGATNDEWNVIRLSRPLTRIAITRTSWDSGYRGYFEPSWSPYTQYMETMMVGNLLVLLQNRTDDIQTDVRIYKGWCHHEFISHAGTLHPIYLVSRDDIPLGVGATPKDARYDSYVRREIKHGLGAGVVQDMLRNIRRDQKVNHTQYRVLMDYGMEDCMEVLLSKGLSPYENNIPMEVFMADMFGVGVNVNGVPTRESSDSGKQGTSVVGLRKKKRLLDI